MPRESLATRKKRAEEILTVLKATYPDARCMLDFATVHQLMVAVILSAQSTDVRVNQVTPALFKKFPTMAAFASARTEDIQSIIHSVGYSGAKARYIQLSANQLMERFGGKVPQTLDELVTLMGIGRKTASVILGVGFGKAEGIVVDTHVIRLSNRFGFATEKDPVKIERELMKIIPEEDWIIHTHLMIFHGRAICKARRPECERCPVNLLCPASTV